MPDSSFFKNAGPLSLQQICDLTGAVLSENADKTAVVSDIASLEDAGPDDVAFIDNPKYLHQVETTRAGACFVSVRFANKIPDTLITLNHSQPYRAFAQTAMGFYPDSKNPGSVYGGNKLGSQTSDSGTPPLVHPSAKISKSAIVDAGAMIGQGAHIGDNSIICSGAVVGQNVKIGSDCYIGPNASVIYALVGDGVVIHSGVQIGQDGFGFAMGADFHLKVPQLGRVIIQDNVEIGSNTAIDRGSLNDTIIGEGTKIDNLVQIAHNVEIGRHCIIVAQTGISGSARLGDFVILGGKVGVLGHLLIDDGAQIAASSNVIHDVPKGARWGGTPSKPVREWLRELNTLQKLSKRSRGKAANE